jgi:hypothetical protein
MLIFVVNWVQLLRSRTSQASIQAPRNPPSATVTSMPHRIELRRLDISTSVPTAYGIRAPGQIPRGRMRPHRTQPRIRIHHVTTA